MAAENDTAFAHETVYGSASDLDYAQLKEKASKSIPYTEADMAGSYHLHRIKNKYPIAGTQVGCSWWIKMFYSG